MCVFGLTPESSVLSFVGSDFPEELEVTTSDYAEPIDQMGFSISTGTSRHNCNTKNSPGYYMNNFVDVLKPLFSLESNV